MEEEEYTSRIIHYFSTGLLTLPEGATLRSYLAEKLNCDPMRITKKYAGASCLGRRVYHFRERIHPTMADIQIARTELDHLEQRFRMRVEGDAGGQKVQSSSSTTQSLVQPSSQIMLPSPAAPQNPIQGLLLGLLTSQGIQNAQQLSGLAGAVPSNQAVANTVMQTFAAAQAAPQNSMPTNGFISAMAPTSMAQVPSNAPAPTSTQGQVGQHGLPLAPTAANK